LEVYASRKGLV